MILPALPLLAAVTGAVFASAFLRGLTGFGFALAAVPILSLVIAPASAVAIAVLLQVAIGLSDMVTLRGLFDRAELLRLSLGALLGTPVGIAALSLLSPNASRIGIAAIVLIGLGFLLRRPTAQSRPRPTLAVGAGLLAGVFSGMAAMPGPPAVAYFLSTDTPPQTARASLMMFFFVAALLATPGLAFAGVIDAQVLILSAVALPALWAGTWAGTAAFRRLGNGHYRKIALAMMAAMALLAGWRGIAAYL